MFVILTALLSFLSSCLPNILKYFEERQRLKYAVQLETIKLEAIVRNAQAATDIAASKDSLDDTISARDADNVLDGGPVINFLRSSVRPVITYSFFSLYFGVKLIAAYSIMKVGITIENAELATKIILDETTISIIIIVIGFYFGSRAMMNREK